VDQDDGPLGLDPARRDDVRRELAPPPGQGLDGPRREAPVEAGDDPRRQRAVEPVVPPLEPGALGLDRVEVAGLPEPGHRPGDQLVLAARRHAPKATDPCHRSAAPVSGCLDRLGAVTRPDSTRRASTTAPAPGGDMPSTFRIPKAEIRACTAGPWRRTPVAPTARSPTTPTSTGTPQGAQGGPLVRVPGREVRQARREPEVVRPVSPARE
jgi:hypothetical protein